MIYIMIFSEYAGQDKINNRVERGHYSDKIDSAPVDRNIRTRKREENFQNLFKVTGVRL